MSKKLFGKLFILLLVVGLLFAATPTKQAEAATITVEPGQSIQAAINAAAPGDTIQVAAGVYVEQLLIQKNLTLVGAGIGQTIVKAPTTGRATAPGYTGQVWTADNWNTDYLLAAYPTDPINGSPISVKITGFTFDANGQGHIVGDRFTGVYFRKVYNVDIAQAGLFASEIKGFSASDQSVTGIRVLENSKLTLDGNLVKDYTILGVVVYGTDNLIDPIVTTSHNTLTPHASVAGVQCIQYRFINGTGTAGEISNNTITNGGYYGITVISSDHVLVKDNTSLAGVGNGITLESASNCIVQGNTIANYPWNGIAVTNPWANSDGNLIQGNTISIIHSGNTSSLGSCGWGIGVDNSSSTAYFVTNTVVTGNNVFSSDAGIVFYGVDATNVAHNNIIHDNSPYNLGNSNASVTIDAENNWWGSAAGPVGTTISGLVDYTPWCGDEACTTLLPPVHNVTRDTYFSTIQAAIDAPTTVAGDVITVAAGTYAETLTIDKQVTLLGPNSEINPNTGTRVGEAVIVYPAGITADTDLVSVSADGVTVAGFTIDGKDLGATLWGEGVFSEANNLTVKNNIVKNFRQIGIRTGALNGGPYYTGALIENNKVTSDVPGIYFSYSGIYLQGTQGVVRGNVVDSANRGIQIQPYTNPATTQGVVENNSFTAYKSPLYFNYSENAHSDWVFRRNILTGIASPTGTPSEYFAGITIETFYSGTVLFEKNQVYTGTANATAIYQYYERGTVNGTRSATPNWWGSAAGPATGQFVGSASYIPWCGEAACTTLVYPEFNGAVSGVFTTSETGVVSGTLTGDYDLTVTGQVTEYVNNRATFSGTVTGDIVGDITATINDNGVDTLAGTITNSGAILPVRILGIFPKSGTAGQFTGQIITGVVPPLATSMSITPSDVSTVFAGGTLQLGVVIDPVAEYGEWSIWEPAGTNTGSTISETGLLTAGTPGTITVIVKALDGSLLDATKVITIQPALVSIAPVSPVVCGNTTTSTIDIMVAGIPTTSPLQGYSFRLHFDTTRTSIATPATDVVNGGFVLGGGFLVTNWIDANGNVYLEPTGILEVAYTQFNPSASTGSGKLASITLTHLGVSGDIVLTLSDVVLSDRDGFVIPSEASATATTLTLQPAVLNTTQNLGYCDLASAVAAAAGGDTIQLQANITIPTTVTVDKALTLDLNGKVATYSPLDNSFALIVGTGGALTVDDTSTAKTGLISVLDGDADGTVDGRGINALGGSLTLNAGTIQAPYAGVYVRPGTSMVMHGGTIGGTVDPLYGIAILGTGSSLDINGGAIEATYFAVTGNGTAGFGDTTITIDGGSLTSTTAAAIYHPQDGNLTINGGTISGYNGIEMKAGNLVVSGGTILGTGAFADPLPNDNGSANTGDAILLNGRNAYTGDITVNITGGTITSTNAYALRDYKAVDQALKTSSVVISGGVFTGGTGKEAVTFSPELRAAELAEPETANLALTGGAYNTDPEYFVFVPYGTKLNTTTNMYEVVGISLNINSFYYWKEGTTFLGVKADIGTTNFLFSEASLVQVELFSGTTGAYVLQQTNTLKVPANFASNSLTSPFNIFGTYVSSSWQTDREAEYGQLVAPTRVLVTVVVPTGTLTAESTVLGNGSYTDIQPSLYAQDFGYWLSGGVRGVTAGFGATNFNFDQATAIEVKLYAGSTLLQTNTAPSTSPLFNSGYSQISGPFDIFGTFNYGEDGYWSNARETEYGQTLVPTRVFATVTLPGGVTVTAENLLLTGDRTTILPGVSGLVTLQGILAPRAGVPITLTSGSVVRTTESTALSEINYGFTGVETLTYTFTTSQARYLNVTDASGKTFLVNGDKTLNPLRLFGGDVNQDDKIELLDASDVGSAWGSTADPAANINYDGIVNIQDLALVGGNYGLTSTTAYTSWSPLP